MLLAILLAGLPACAAAGAIDADRHACVVHPRVWRVLEDNDDRANVWVFLTDKGLESEEAQRAAIRRLETTYNRRALARRKLRRTAPGLFDRRDIPVCGRYVERVTATGATKRVTSKWLNAVSVSASAEQIRIIARLAFVRSIEPVRRGVHTEAVPLENVATVPSAPADGFYGLAEEQLQQIAIIDMHAAGYTGDGIIIGVLDTGFARTHEAFTYPGHPIQVVAEWDFVNDDPNTAPEPGDPVIHTPHGTLYQHAHGTMILGTIAAYKPNDLVGGAYDASFILAKTEDISDEYPAEEDFYVAGLEFIEANGGDMATSSLGYYQWYDYHDMDGRTAVTTIGVNAATENGLVCCTAVGNRGRDHDWPSLIAPSDAFDVIACGAVNALGELSDFSSNGPTADGRVKPEVLARGEMTATVDPIENAAYAEADGTSMSTPLVASAVALLLEARPHWTIPQIRTALFETGSYYVAHGTYDPLSHQGYGIINVMDALYTLRGDLNCDGTFNGADIDAFFLALGDPAAYATTYPGCPIENGDMNRDGSVNGADIDVFFACLGGGNCP